MRRYHDAQAKCPQANGNGVLDFYYNSTTPLDTSSCYGFFQATYTSDAGMTNISHLPLDYLVDYAGNMDTVSQPCDVNMHALFLADQAYMCCLRDVCLMMKRMLNFA